MTPERCPGCDGHGVATVELAPGQRLCRSCEECGGTGLMGGLTDAILRQVETCHSKHSYTTRAKAFRAINGIRARGRAIERPYKCPVCKQFHLTSMRRERRPGGEYLELPNADR